MRLEFDKKLFSSNLDKIESKLKRVAQDYTVCLDNADDSEMEIGKEQAEIEKQKCHKSTN